LAVVEGADAIGVFGKYDLRDVRESDVAMGGVSDLVVIPIFRLRVGVASDSASRVRSYSCVGRRHVHGGSNSRVRLNRYDVAEVDFHGRVAEDKGAAVGTFVDRAGGQGGAHEDGNEESHIK
jgi:hypothetical protein